MVLDNKFKDIINIIKSSRVNALKAVNRELMDLHWNIGVLICKDKDTEVVDIP